MAAVIIMKAHPVFILLVCIAAILCWPAYAYSQAASTAGSSAPGPPKQEELARKAYQGGDLAEAEKLLLAAEQDSEKKGEERNLELADILRDLGLVYSTSGRQDEAEAAIRRSLKIRMAALPADSQDIAECFNPIALVKKEREFGPEHPEVASSLNNLAGFYRGLGRSADAEFLYKRSLSVAESVLGPDNPDAALIQPGGLPRSGL